MSVIIRTLQSEDLTSCFALTQKLRWPHREEDWKEATFLGEGVVAVVNDEVIGCVLFWRWGEKVATIGLVIVDERFYGQGIGKQLMSEVLHRLGNVAIKLHATEMGKGLYRKLGFTAVGNVYQLQTPNFDQLSTFTLPSELKFEEAKEEDLSQLVELDRSANGMLRTRLIEYLYKKHHLLLARSVNGQIVGFAARRLFGRGWVIGPLIAANVNCAKSLLAMQLSHLNGEFVRIDTGSEPLKKWLVSLGFKEVDAPVTMIYGKPWSVSNKIEPFCLMTQAMA